MNGLLPADHPGIQGVFHEPRDCCSIEKLDFFQVANHVGRHLGKLSDLIDLEFPRFQKLRLFRRDADGRISCPSSSTAILLLLALPPKVDCQPPAPVGGL